MLGGGAWLGACLLGCTCVETARLLSLSVGPHIDASHPLCSCPSTSCPPPGKRLTLAVELVANPSRVFMVGGSRGRGAGPAGTAMAGGWQGATAAPGASCCDAGWPLADPAAARVALAAATPTRPAAPQDEPTSGLDARAAGIVMDAVRSTVDTGRVVVCTM